MELVLVSIRLSWWSHQMSSMYIQWQLRDNKLHCQTISTSQLSCLTSNQTDMTTWCIVIRWERRWSKRSPPQQIRMWVLLFLHHQLLQHNWRNHLALKLPSLKQATQVTSSLLVAENLQNSQCTGLAHALRTTSSVVLENTTPWWLDMQRMPTRQIRIPKSTIATRLLNSKLVYKSKKSKDWLMT